jgi:hypothetical protein
MTMGTLQLNMESQGSDQVGAEQQVDISNQPMVIITISPSASPCPSVTAF